MKLQQQQIEQLISQQASEWIEVLKTGGVEERAAFVAWLKESRRHVGEFLAMVAVDRELKDVDSARRHDLAELIEKISPPSERVTGIRDGLVQAQPRLPERWLRPASLAAGVLLAVLGAVAVQSRFFSAQDFATAKGEQRIVQLSDGSVVHLNTQSEIEVRIDNGARDIRLIEGEALFKVARDQKRPFKVRTESATVQALGTEFNVYVHPHETTVSVLEGKVQVSSQKAVKDVAPSPVSAGQEVRVDEQGQMRQTALKDVEKVMAWQQRRLIFRDNTLADMAAEFNRYNRAQFRLEGDDIKQRHYAGTFDADDPGSLAALLSRETDLKIEERNGDYVIRKWAVNTGRSE